VVGSDSWRIEARLLKAIFLKSDRHGELSLRDCLSPWAASLKLSLPGGEDRAAEFIYEARLSAASMLPEQRKAVQAAISALQGIEAAFKGAPGALKPKFDYLLRLLNAAKNLLDDTLSSTMTTETPENSSPAQGVRNSSSGGPASTRDEALRKLAEAADYFRRVEPSSPIPLLIKRVQTLAGLDFARLIQELELGEGAVKEFRKQAGIREEASK
jgi:type VI secretion system protein ImpA